VAVKMAVSYQLLAFSQGVYSRWLQQLWVGTTHHFHCQESSGAAGSTLTYLVARLSIPV
jgi:hypothetical protein